ncbi:MAG: GTP-dependent dephospho-CoA kinase family protein [Thaumarchaeota archaeon]|nr:GTP-dependent dephospho-CoA kinase family protein [Nitrososphaerota archaeon]
MGLLLQDSDVTKENILKTVPKEAYLITVGDATAEKMTAFGLGPSLQIVDSLEKRHKRALPVGNVRTTLHCANPAAHITDESVSVIKKALVEKPPVRIIVDGEEDLLVLPAVLYAPDNSIIMYGQPNEGLVIVKVNDKTRKTAKKIMDSMT